MYSHLATKGLVGMSNNVEKMSTTRAARRAARWVCGGAKALSHLKRDARRAARRAAKGASREARRADARDVC